MSAYFELLADLTEDVEPTETPEKDSDQLAVKKQVFIFWIQKCDTLFCCLPCLLLNYTPNANIFVFRLKDNIKRFSTCSSFVFLGHILSGLSRLLFLYGTCHSCRKRRQAPRKHGQGASQGDDVEKSCFDLHHFCGEEINCLLQEVPTMC